MECTWLSHSVQKNGSNQPSHLQETHLTDAELPHLKLKHFDKIFSSTFNSKQRGISILINKSIPFFLASSVTDPNGRFIIINVTINHTALTLANIYGPNNDPYFFNNFFLPPPQFLKSHFSWRFQHRP